jgi:hypothetical protein
MVLTQVAMGYLWDHGTLDPFLRVGPSDMDEMLLDTPGNGGSPIAGWFIRENPP